MIFTVSAPVAISCSSCSSLPMPTQFTALAALAALARSSSSFMWEKAAIMMGVSKALP